VLISRWQSGPTASIDLTVVSVDFFDVHVDFFDSGVFETLSTAFVLLPPAYGTFPVSRAALSGMADAGSFSSWLVAACP
jgi:hypothetical protein